MKSKFKDYLLYTLSTIGVVALFISATTLPPQTSTVPESHVWDIAGDGVNDVYMWNKVSGEVRALTNESPTKYGIYKTLNEDKKK